MPRRKSSAPTLPIPLPEYHSHESRIDWLMPIAALLERFSLTPYDTAYDMVTHLQAPWPDHLAYVDHFRATLLDLFYDPCFSTTALAAIMNIKHLNLDILLKNQRYRPKIRLFAEITARRNLSVRWVPWEYRMGENVTSDYLVDQLVYLAAASVSPYRPYNELMFIHGVGDLRWGRPDYPPLTEPLRHYISYAVIAAYRDLQHLLEALFDVKVDTEVEVFQGEHGLMRWELVDVSEEAQEQTKLWIEETQEQTGLWISTFAESYGVSLAEFQATISDPDYRDERGCVVDTKVSRDLLKRKKAHKLTPHVVGKIVRRLNHIRKAWPSLLGPPA